MKIFKNKWFDRFCKKQNITDKKLLKLISNIENGKIDVDYGGFVIKQRLARDNQGKSGGYRNIILYRSGDKAFFVYGYAKKDKDNLNNEEVSAFREMATELLKLSEDNINKLIKQSKLIEVKQDEKK
ncbi:type II toxin-antitoxin system RelE/ParE family toxin [Thiotrichales bacterium 19X7-9]|nr:type II toxin-antitoxin system RelE/ParE family toxin [Thiotrichales bacterium 19X7-9]